jgi:hypothetical protein
LISKKEAKKMAFVKFASSHAGRWARIIVGIVLFAGGLWLIQGALGLIVAIVGLVPLVAGTLDVCLFAPLFGAPLNGAKVRATATQPTTTKSR